MSGIPNTPAEARKSHLESVFWRRTLRWGLRLVPPALQRVTMPMWSGLFYLQVPHVRRPHAAQRFGHSGRISRLGLEVALHLHGARLHRSLIPVLLLAK